MPFKDPEQRKAYQRSYQALRRARLKVKAEIREGKVNPPAHKAKVKRGKPSKLKWVYIQLWVELGICIVVAVLAGLALWKAYQVEDIVHYWFGR